MCVSQLKSKLLYIYIHGGKHKDRRIYTLHAAQEGIRGGVEQGLLYFDRFMSLQTHITGLIIHAAQLTTARTRYHIHDVQHDIHFDFDFARSTMFSVPTDYSMRTVNPLQISYPANVSLFMQNICSNLGMIFLNFISSVCLKLEAHNIYF